MSEYIKLKITNPQELLSKFELDSDINLSENANISDAITALTSCNQYGDAIKLLAHGLPKREAVWWACLATRATQSDTADENNVNALIATEDWVKKPSEENLKRVNELSKATKYETAASWAATAAAWCTGSLTPEGEEPVAPPEYLYAHAVAGSILLASHEGDGESASQNELLQLFLKQGLDLAKGGNGKVE
ncbi:MAG: hypothetical protein ACI93R_001492 [Flavobacteriales bacterium]|jgi:hypothetical protein